MEKAPAKSTATNFVRETANGNSSPVSRDARRRAGKMRPPAVQSGATVDPERLRIALHDGLGQLLTSISFLASSLKQKLAERDLPEASEAAEIVSLTGRAISETQSLTRDPLSPSQAE
jgi:signal transduction histidine kinase